MVCIHPRITLATADGWEVTSDGGTNAFVSHVFGDNRPAGLESLTWVGLNEASSKGHFDAHNKLRARASGRASCRRVRMSDNFSWTKPPHRRQGCELPCAL